MNAKKFEEIKLKAKILAVKRLKKIRAAWNQTNATNKVKADYGGK